VRLLRLGLLLGAATVATALARAETFEAAPSESQLQVQSALKALRPFFVSRSRRIASGEQGTIEHAIHNYAPGSFHPVDEGALPPPVANARCPADMASIDGRFCIDRYEGSLVERQPGGALQPWSPYTPPPLPPSFPSSPSPSPSADGHAILARSVAGVVPQAYVSAAQAALACGAVGKRLCQPVEWRAACGGSQGRAYPYGPSHVPGKCHDTGVAPMLVLHAAELKKGWGPVALNDPQLNQIDGTVAKTGAFPDCVNDYGVYDMVGNLHEWTADPHGTFQGGYWLDTELHGEACAYRTIAHDYGYHDYSTGFRCCAAPEADASAASAP
jgi:sulfatase modifying factor 1